MYGVTFPPLRDQGHQKSRDTTANGTTRYVDEGFVLGVGR